MVSWSFATALGAFALLSFAQNLTVPSDLPGSWTYQGCYVYGNSVVKEFTGANFPQ